MCNYNIEKNTVQVRKNGRKTENIAIIQVTRNHYNSLQRKECASRRSSEAEIGGWLKESFQ
jgi:hypothetical protein